MLLKSAESTEFCESFESTEPNESNESKLSDDYAKNLTLYERVHKEYALLSEQIPYPKCALNFKNPFELLVATVLSAQTTDKRVNLVTKTCFLNFQMLFLYLKLRLAKWSI